MIEDFKTYEPQRTQKAAIYIRVSTTYQADKDSLPMQRKDLISYAELILGIPEYEIFEDAGYSGKNTDRPAYQEMMSRIKSGEFSHLLVWKIDRISRNLMDFAEMYSELKRLKVVFVSKNEQFDTSSAMGEAMLKIILVFAELERNMTAERVTATMISRANQGQWNGGRVPYGYDYDQATGLFTIRDDEAEVCRLLKDDYLCYHSLVHTARYLNSQGYKTRAGVDWSPTAVWIIAQSPFYAGIYRYNRYKGTEHRTRNNPDDWVISNDHHPAIFTTDEHNRMLEILDYNKRTIGTPDQSHRTKNVYVFRQICYCGKCGAKMTATSGRLQADGYRTYVYGCANRRRTNNCNNQATNDLIIGEFVINYISNIIKAKKSFSEIHSPQELEKRLLRGQAFKRVANIEASGLNEFYNLLAAFKRDDAFTLISKHKRKREKVNAEISALKKDKEKQERALSRLQELYLYSDKSITEKEFILQRAEITNRIEDINRKLGMKESKTENTISDEEFIRKASHLVINSRLQDREYIYYKNLAASTSPEVLQEYISALVDNINIADSLVLSITFKNGITNKFIYDKGQG